jgi:hypothetical protein
VLLLTDAIDFLLGNCGFCIFAQRLGAQKLKDALK